MREIACVCGVNIHFKTKLVEVGEDYFLVEKDGIQEKVPFDLGFVCLGIRAEAPLMEVINEYAKEKMLKL